jgi:uncharacterized membrane protein YbhN (UPF0104 family)
MRALSPAFGIVLQVAISAVLLAVLWHLADGGEAARRLASADPAWLGAALGALTLQIVLSALRWRLTAAQFGIALDRATALREYYLAQIVNQVLPGGMLGDAGRALRGRAQAGFLASAQAVVFERLAGQIALFAVFAAAVMVSLAVPGWIDWPGWLLWPVAGLLGAGLAAPLLVRLACRWPRGRMGRAMAGFGHAFHTALAAPHIRARQVALSLLTALLNVAAFAFCAMAVGATLSPVAALVIVPLILLSMLVPITISGWGLREGAAAALMPLAGVPVAEALAASVAFGLAVLVVALPGVASIGPRTFVKPLKF